jgi:hypothetical protein
MIVIEITFGEHIAANRVSSMISSIAAYGNVFQGTDARSFRCEVFRASKLPNLKLRLVDWDKYGFLCWREVS